MPLILGTGQMSLFAMQGGEPCGSQGTSPCHFQAMEADIWFGHVTRHYSLCSLSSSEGIIVGEGDNIRAGSTTPYNGQS